MDGKMNDVVEFQYPLGRTLRSYNLYRTDSGAPRGVSLSHKDKLWFSAGLKYSIHWYQHCIIPLDGRRDLLVSLRKEAHRIEAAFSIRYIHFGCIRTWVVSALPCSADHFKKHARELAASNR